MRRDASREAYETLRGPPGPIPTLGYLPRTPSKWLRLHCQAYRYPHHAPAPIRAFRHPPLGVSSSNGNALGSVMTLPVPTLNRTFRQACATGIGREPRVWSGARSKKKQTLAARSRFGTSAACDQRKTEKTA